MADNGLITVLHNLPAGNWAAGDRGIACQPARVNEFREGVSKAITYATALGVTQLNCLAGKPANGVTDAMSRQTLVSNLRFAATELRKSGLKLMVEAVNHHDVPGFYLNRSAQTLALLDEVGAANAYFQYDVYHMQRMEGELALTLEKNLARIGHIQIADTPGRHEPGSGEINYPFLMGHLDRIGYKGWVGCEYIPATVTEDGLGWLEQFK
jgi:hydroxypyruvate isomerase